MEEYVQPDSDQDKRDDEPAVALDSVSKSPVAREIIAK
jgi:hypothetical protein